MKCALTVVIALTLYLAGCCIVHPRVKEPSPLGAWSFKTCAHNGDHEVCECKIPTETVNAVTGEIVHVCY